MDKDLGEGMSRDEEEDLGLSDLPSDQLKRIYEMKEDISFIKRQERNNRVGGLNLKNVMICDKQHTVVMAINRLV